MTTVDRRSFLLAAGGLALMPDVFAASQPYPVDMKTLTYSSPGGKDLQLDLYLPQGVGRPLPVIVFLHGGGWFAGTRTTGPDFKRFFAEEGFAMASLDYRLTPAITFPANAEDVKTAVRWLRANAQTHGVDPARVGLWGTSAGGHLAAIAGLTPRGMFEGEGNADQSSAVQCVLDAYGPSDFLQMDAQAEAEKSRLQAALPALANAGPGGGGAPPRPADAQVPPPMPSRHDDPNSPESRVVGAPLRTVPDKVKAANPVTYVAKGAPPFLLMHGLADSTVPHGQSILLYEALAKAGNDATLRLVDSLPHTFFSRNNVDELGGPFRMDVRTAAGGREQRSEERAPVYAVARDFFKTHLMEQ